MIVLYSGDGVLCEVRAEEEQTTRYEVWSVVNVDISMTDCQSLAKI
jgi:hypothetical protein